MVIRVMVVEDHDLIREVLVAALEAEQDIEVVACCADGQTAIENLDQANPDVVVTDLSLPRGDRHGPPPRWRVERRDGRLYPLAPQPGRHEVNFAVISPIRSRTGYSVKAA